MGRGWPKAVGLSIAGGLLVALPPRLPAYPLTLLTQALIYAVFAMSLDLLLGYTGLPSLGHAAYFGVAAYVVAILATEYRAEFWTCLLLALLAAIVVSALFGLVAIRALGVYFLMITLALGMVMWGLAFRWVSLTKGDDGISAIGRPSLGLPWSFSDPTAVYYLTLATFLLAFILAGGFAGLAGVLWAYYNGFVSPVEVQLVTSVETLLMVALGGPGTLVGPALGAGVIVWPRGAGQPPDRTRGRPRPGAHQDRLPGPPHGPVRPDRQGHGGGIRALHGRDRTAGGRTEDRGDCRGHRGESGHGPDKGSQARRAGPGPSPPS